MKSPIIPAFGLVLVLILNFWAIFHDNFVLENLCGIFYFFLAVLLILPKKKRFNTHFYIFILFSILTYITRIISDESHIEAISLFYLFIANVALILESSRFIVHSKASKMMSLYFLLILAVYFTLLAVHVFEIRSFLPNEVTFWMYSLYYLNLFVLGVTGFLYYLNSYSRKSVYFISLVLGIIFAEILRDMSLFYFRDISVQLAESIIRAGCAVFFVLFYATRERKLRLLNLI